MCVTRYATHPDVGDIVRLGFNKGTLKNVFQLPTKRDLNVIRYSYEPNAEIYQFLRFIGYAEDIEMRTLFRRHRLPPMWNTLFSILNKALTCKVGSPHQSSHAILEIMYRIYSDLPLDYVGLIYGERTSAIEAKV